ncbi:hypothetical protein HN698_07540, partial [Candidatus Woesearchaeota archaeon]|nr:hypothetical protein [Candidatus Woesearchaeota archaeon]
KKMWDKINGQKLTVKDIRIVGESNSDSNKPDEGHKTPKNPSNKSIIQFKSDHSKQNFSLKIQYYEQTISNSDKQKLVELLEELLSKIR